MHVGGGWGASRSGQDSTRGPASACRGSRLRGARVWSRCSASVWGPLVMVSAPCRGRVRHGPMSRRRGPSARRLSCCWPAEVACLRVRGRRAAACCGERAGCVHQRQGSGACQGPELGRGAGAGLLGSGLKALAGAFVTDPTAEDVDGFARFQRASASAAVAARLLKAGPRSTSALGPHSRHPHNPAAIGHALAQHRSDPPGRSAKRPAGMRRPLAVSSVQPYLRGLAKLTCELGPGRVKIGWMPCLCAPAQPRAGRGPAWGISGCSCEACREEHRESTFYEPPHDVSHWPVSG